MKALKALAIAALLVCVSGFNGCTSFFPRTGAERVYAAIGMFDASVVAATAYANLPRCDAPGALKPLCSDRVVLDHLGKAIPATRDTLMVWKNAVCTSETMADGKRVCKSAFNDSVINNATVAGEAALKSFTTMVEALPKR